MTAFELACLLITVPLLTWVPGWLAWRASGAEEADSLNRAERTFLHIFVSLLICAGLATLLAELGIFSLVSLFASLALVCLALWRLRNQVFWLQIRSCRLPGYLKSMLRQLQAGEKPGFSKIRGLLQPPTSNLQPPTSNLQSPTSNLQSPSSLWAAGLLAILALAAALFFRPAEAVLVMDDAGVYTIHGLTLARTGRLDVQDPLLPSLSSANAEQLLLFVRYQSTYLRHQGFYIWNWWWGLIRPSFFHLPSIWVAILASIGGERAGLWATPLAGLVAVAAFALLSRRLFGRGVGLAAPLLLTVSFPQVWYARYPTSEMFMQAWLLGGLFLLTLFLQHRTRFAAVTAGVGLGQLFLIRVDAWLAALAVGLYFVGWGLKARFGAQPLQRDASSGWFLVPLGLTLLWAGLHAVLFASPYIISLMHLYLTPRLGALAMVGAAAVALAMLIIWYRPPRVPVEGLKLPAAGATRWVAGLIIAGAWAVVSVVGTGASVGGDALRWLSWYYTPLGLAVALFGLALVVRQGVSRPARVLLSIALVYVLLYLPDPRANPMQPWGVRRFVPAVLPVLVLMMAYFAARFPVPGSERLQRAARIGLVLILALVLVQSTRPLLDHDEYAGVWDQVEILAGKFEPGAVVLFNQTGVGQAVTQPLTYLYDRPSFVLQAERPDTQMIRELAHHWIAEGRPVYLAITGLAPWLADLDMDLEPAGDVGIQSPRLERSLTHLPRRVEMMNWPIDLYRVRLGRSRSVVNRLEMGPGELLYLQAGFYDREVTPDGTTFRWTNGQGQLRLPVSPGGRRLTFRVSGPPAGAPRPVLTVFVDGRQAGAWELPQRFITLGVDVPAAAVDDGRLDVELRSDTWVPSDDDRRLGIVVDWVAVSNDE